MKFEGSTDRGQSVQKADVFIAHAWRIHDEWQSLVNILDSIPDLTWRNFSVPWHDPALRSSTDQGLRLIEEIYVSQIVSVDFCVVILDLLRSKSNARWLHKAIETAKAHGVPISAVYFDPQCVSYADPLGLSEPLRGGVEEVTNLIDQYGKEAAFRYL